MRSLPTFSAIVTILAGFSGIAAAEPLTASYDKAVVLATEDGGFKLRLNLRNQFRVEVTRIDDDEPASRIYVPRSRLSLDGNVFGPDTRFKLELGLGDAGSFSFLKDVYVERAVGPVWARIGQWKRPFNRQELVADFGSAFNERAITARFAGGGRDLGVAIHNDYEASPDGLEWVLGVFNTFSGGADRPITSDVDVPPTTFPVDFAPAIVARAGWNTGGIKGYSEIDLEGGPLRLGVGVSYKIDLADVDPGAQSHGVGVDAMLKVEGFDLELGAFLMKLDEEDGRIGAMIQGGYLVVPDRAHLAARFAAVQDAADRDRLQLEARLAFSWLWEGHRWKIASDVGLLQLTGADAMTMATAGPDLQARSMAQLTF